MVTDINECQSNLDDCEHTCYNTIGSFTCGCQPGYTLASADGSVCIGEHIVAYIYNVMCNCKINGEVHADTVYCFLLT